MQVQVLSQAPNQKEDDMKTIYQCDYCWSNFYDKEECFNHEPDCDQNLVKHVIFIALCLEPIEFGILVAKIY